MNERVGCWKTESYGTTLPSVSLEDSKERCKDRTYCTCETRCLNTRFLSFQFSHVHVRCIHVRYNEDARSYFSIRDAIATFENLRAKKSPTQTETYCQSRQLNIEEEPER